jgi:non-homologous end joining protein Ku
MKNETKLPVPKNDRVERSFIEDYTKEVLNNFTVEKLKNELWLTKRQMQESSNEYFDSDYYDEYVDLIQELINKKNNRHETINKRRN